MVNTFHTVFNDYVVIMVVPRHTLAKPFTLEILAGSMHHRRMVDLRIIAFMYTD